MFITIQKNLGSSRHYHPRIFITTQTIWGVVDITIQEFSLPSKIIFWWFKSVENEQDFEFLAGMLLLRRVNGSSSFYKGPRTCKVWKSGSLDFQTLLVLGPLQKLLLPLTFRSNVPLHRDELKKDGHCLLDMEIKALKSFRIRKKSKFERNNLKETFKLGSSLKHARFIMAWNFWFFFPLALVLLHSNRVLVGTSSFEWKLYHFEQNKLSFDDFLMTIWERENESKKEPQIPRQWQM